MWLIKATKSFKFEEKKSLFHRVRSAGKKHPKNIFGAEYFTLKNCENCDYFAKCEIMIQVSRKI